MRTILVTGSSSGIGKAIAARLLRDGERVVLHGRDAGKLAAAARELSTAGGEVHMVAGDVREESDVRRLVEQILERCGRLDGLVNNAGGALRNAPVDRCSAQDFDSMIALNLRSVFLVSRAALPHLVRARGAIVNVASNLAQVAIEGLAAYSAAKAAVVSLTRSMALDHGDSGVRVNCVLPGLVSTPLTEPDPAFASQKLYYESRAALHRIGKPDDVAGAVRFLLSDEARWITGQPLVVDGGYTLS